MKEKVTDTLILVGVGIAALYLIPRIFPSLVRDVVGGAKEGLEEGVNAVGEVVGIPRTDANKCATARALGNGFDASKYCDASTFISYVFGNDDAAQYRRAALEYETTQKRIINERLADDLRNEREGRGFIYENGAYTDEG